MTKKKLTEVNEVTEVILLIAPDFQGGERNSEPQAEPAEIYLAKVEP